MTFEEWFESKKYTVPEPLSENLSLENMVNYTLRKQLQEAWEYGYNQGVAVGSNGKSNV